MVRFGHPFAFIDYDHTAMSLRRDVVERLLLAKSLLNKIRFDPTAEPDRRSLAGHIITAHDAAELALGAVAHQLGALPTREKNYLMDYFEPIRQAAHKDRDVEGKTYCSQLNRVRVDIKHLGLFPDPKQWPRVGETVYGYASKWCSDYLGTTLDHLDESTLLGSERAKAYYDAAVVALDEVKYEGVLVQIAKALHIVFTENSALRRLRVGNAKPEDAIKLAGFGVHANDFLTLQEFLPNVNEGPDGTLIHTWTQQRFGHPGNWRSDSAAFCLSAFLAGC